MNGRIYDPQIGRFLSADVIIDGADSLQGYNRYSYVHNNPLALVDPDGNCATSFASFQRNMGMPDKEVAKETFKSGAESIPGVGEISDLAVLTGSNSTPRERLIAGGSLALNIATAGFAPNFGRKANSVVDAVEEGMEASSDAAKSAARKADGTIPNSSNLDQNAPTSGSRPEVDTNAGPAGDATNVDGGKTYQTYTKTNPETGEVYTGRTSGAGTPEQNVANRDRSHHMNDKGFGPAQLDKSSANKDAIRGREQQLIDANGGAQSQGGTSGNAINGISDSNKKRKLYLDAADEEF